MNKTQRVAWVNLVTTLLCLTIIGYIFFNIAILKKMPEGLLDRSWPLIVFFVLIGWVFVWMRRRQSPKEVDADEHDELIKKRAAMVGFVSVSVVLLVASVIPLFILGEDGCVPAWTLPLVNLGVLLIAGTIHSAAILVQYGWGGKNGGK